MKKIIPIILAAVAVVALVIMLTGSNERTKGETTLGDVELGISETSESLMEGDGDGSVESNHNWIETPTRNRDVTSEVSDISNDVDQDCDGADDSAECRFDRAMQGSSDSSRDDAIADNCGEGTDPLEGDCDPEAIEEAPLGSDFVEELTTTGLQPVEATFEHTVPGEYSTVIASVETFVGDDVEITVTGPSVEEKFTKTVAADDNGIARATFKVFQYGQYNVVAIHNNRITKSTIGVTVE